MEQEDLDKLVKDTFIIIDSTIVDNLLNKAKKTRKIQDDKISEKITNCINANKLSEVIETLRKKGFTYHQIKYWIYVNTKPNILICTPSLITQLWTYKNNKKYE